jgi:folylpolyglutamate synthase/dihydropteroate synthase
MNPEARMQAMKEQLLSWGSLNAKVVHIAGSKGKGTTAHLLARLLELHGKKVGLFTSPAILNETESVLVNHEAVSEERLENLKEDVKKESREFLETHSDEDDELSEFEVLTLAALKYFQEEGCEYIVLECGWGGKKDATNIVDDKALTILTHLEEEHLGILGNDIFEIAQEKMGICREAIPLLTTLNREAVLLNLIEEEAARLDFPLMPCPEVDLGFHHPESVGFALAAGEFLKIVTNEEDLKDLEEFQIPGRFEILPYKGHTLVLDGAHTPDSVASFKVRLFDYMGEKKVSGKTDTLLEPFFALHFLKDKDPHLHELFPRNRSVWVPLEHERAGENLGGLNESSLSEVLGKLDLEKKSQVLCIVGSFRLVAEAYRLIGA